MTFEELKAKKITPADFLQYIWLKSTGLKRTGLALFEPTKIYRTRVFNHEMRPSHLKDLSYPPKNFAQLQRASCIGEPVFYSSLGIQTALVESRVKNNEYVILSEWQNIAEMVLMPIGLSTESENEYEILLNKVFSYKGDELYDYSSLIAKHLMTGDTISGLIYPSISSNYESQNIALHPHYVDENLQFISAHIFRVEDIANEEFELTNLALGIQNDSKLEWQAADRSKLYITSDNVY